MCRSGHQKTQRGQHHTVGTRVMLDPSINYIVSGLERSGTSMLMQMLANANIPVSADTKRPADENNPKGYYELEGGKIINKLMDGSFDFNAYKGSFIKITCYGLKFLPTGTFKIIYSERNIEEILDSMEKMAQMTDKNREETKDVFLRLNAMIKQQIMKREDCDTLLVNYNQILEQPTNEMERIKGFLCIDDLNIQAMIQTIDKQLYRERH
jgi:hypothetical protein